MRREDPEDPACEPIASCPTSDDPGYVDGDGDVRADACDRCPDVATPIDVDSDRDGIGDACDLCPFDFDPSNADLNGDGDGDVCERCGEGVQLETPSRLRILNFDTRPGDDRLVLLATFAVEPGTMLEEVAKRVDVEVLDAREAVAFVARLGDGSPVGRNGWTQAPAALPWTLRFKAPQGAFPKIRAWLRFHPQDPTRVQLKVRAVRGGFAALAPELPLRVIIDHAGAGPCAKGVYRADGAPTCVIRAGGKARCR
ncbi:MAG TPA: hypothetical protein VIS07_22880 [Candidatus Binatia bacterium]